MIAHRLLGRRRRRRNHATDGASGRSALQIQTTRHRSGGVCCLSVCLPVLVLVVFGSIEACTMVFLKESLTVAAYESSRVALDADGTESAAMARGTAVLSERGISGGTVQITPANIATVASGDPIEIRVTAPCAANAVIPVWFYSGRSITSTLTVMKEY